MAVVIPPGFGQAAVQFRNEGDPDPWYITFGVLLSEVGGDYDAACENIIQACSEGFIGDMSQDTTCTGVRLTVGQDGGDNLVVFTPADLSGTDSGAKLPQNCALLVDKTTLLGGRRNRGRFFLPNVLSESAVNNVGVINSGTVSSFQSAINTMFSVLATGEGEITFVPTPMVILHNEGTGSGQPTPVTQLKVQSVISTQRRRLR